MGQISTRDNPTSVGNRVKSARMLSGHSRRSFSAESSISMATLRAWEEPTAGRYGLTKKGAERFVSALNEMGVYCTTDWLLHGVGPGPNIIRTAHEMALDIEEVSWGEEEAILKDIEAFKRNNHDPIVAIVTDGSMLPKFSYGDYVGGCKVYGEEIKKLIGVTCIIGIDEKTVIRRLTSASGSRYTLTALNQESTTVDTVITDIILKFAAEITWHRWRKKIQDITI